jgi:hypothetical protein
MHASDQAGWTEGATSPRYFLPNVHAQSVADASGAAIHGGKSIDGCTS